MVQKSKAVMALSPAKKLKKASAQAPPSAESDEDDEDPEVDEEAEEKVVSVKQREQELTAARKSELKAMPADMIKKLVLDRDLEHGAKEASIEKLLKVEAKDRKMERDRQDEFRTIISTKKDEFESFSVSDLAKQCSNVGIKATTKQARVECLLKQWQEDDGINKALAQKAYQKRKDELDAMDSPTLLKLCHKIGVDAFVSEVMADRVLKKEIAAGRFARPVLEETKAEGSASGKKPRDIVEAMLASDANRKKQLEQEKQEEEEVAEKLKELRAKSKEDLEKMLKKKGLEITGKKDDLVAALCMAFDADRKVEARKAELQALGQNSLKEFCTRKRLATPQKVEDLIKIVLDHEARCREELIAHEAVAAQIVAKKKEEIMQNSNAELKEMLEAKDLKVGVGKEGMADRLLEHMTTTGEVDKIVATQAKDVRRTELISMNKKSLRTLCDELGADPLVQAVAIERILDAEEEAQSDEPRAKRAKKVS